MSSADPNLLAASHPLVGLLLYAAAAVYTVALIATLVRPPLGGWLLGAGSMAHLASMIGRGWVIGYFPLTNKHESFLAASLAIVWVTVWSWKNVRLYVVPLQLLAAVSLATAMLFPSDFSYPPPLMRTVWYPTHVPLSFFAYAVWFAAAAAALAWSRERDPKWLTLIDRLALQGFGLWTVSMICGGIWGVVAWGAYFMWDPKIIWSVILWFHYASFIHLRLTPSLADRPWVRPVLALIGALWVLVAYVGTSFLFGRSSHAF